MANPNPIDIWPYVHLGHDHGLAFRRVNGGFLSDPTTGEILVDQTLDATRD